MRRVARIVQLSSADRLSFRLQFWASGDDFGSIYRYLTLHPFSFSSLARSHARGTCLTPASSAKLSSRFSRSSSTMLCVRTGLSCQLRPIGCEEAVMKKAHSPTAYFRTSDLTLISAFWILRRGHQPGYRPANSCLHGRHTRRFSNQSPARSFRRSTDAPRYLDPPR